MKECRKDTKVVTEDEVKTATGKGWDEWFRILDEVGIAEKGHDPMVKHLLNHHSLSQTWAQTVARRYENDRGLRHITA